MVEIGKTWRSIFAKCVLRVTGPEDTHVCQYDQLCAGLMAVISWVVHRIQDIWDVKLSTEDWGLILIDAKNACNEIYLIGTLWTIFHLGTSGTRFVFNCYWHW